MNLDSENKEGDRSIPWEMNQAASLFACYTALISQYVG